MNNVTNFKVHNLHGYNSYDLEITDNTLILIGENGTGKTSVLRLMFYLLTGQWMPLSNYIFDKITITIDNKDYSIDKSQLNVISKTLHSKLKKRLPHSFWVDIQDLIFGRDVIDLTRLHYYSDKYGIPYDYIMEMIEEYGDSNLNDNINNTLNSIRESLDCNILYLPTYRRIEEELNRIFKDIDEREIKYRSTYVRRRKEVIEDPYVELIEFGMRDVDRDINKVLAELKEFERTGLNVLTLGYLSDVVDEKYTRVDIKKIQNIEEHTINDVLNRIRDTMLSRKNKAHLFDTLQKIRNGEEPSHHDMIVCHYFIKLLNFQQELKIKESNMTNFCKICNEYMVGKEFSYNSTEFEFSISQILSNKEYGRVELRNLSSGEKQIVSLFSHLYLSAHSDYFVLIDEPELSLSVPWQRKFLIDIKEGGFCSGLIAVTHSPFIYDNELKAFARGLGEFRV